MPISPDNSLDEVLIKDESGFKVVAGGQLKPWQKPAPVQPVEVDMAPPIRTADLQKAADEILQAVGLESLDQFLKVRFKNLVISRLKEVRNKIETEEFLKRSLAVGGMGFAEATADKVIKIIEKKILTLGDQLRNLAQEKSELELELGKLVKELQTYQFGKSVTPSLPSPVPSPTKVPPASTPPPARPAVLAPAKPEKLKVSEEISPRLAPKIVTKLTGPVEEIKDLTLVNWRRLAVDPNEATKNIYNKILLLEQESFAKKVQAILGWRQSEVFKIYREIGSESMDGKKSVEQIISEWQAAGHPTLTLAEFEAVMDLNQKLRF